MAHQLLQSVGLRRKHVLPSWDQPGLKFQDGHLPSAGHRASPGAPFLTSHKQTTSTRKGHCEGRPEDVCVKEPAASQVPALWAAARSGCLRPVC